MVVVIPELSLMGGQRRAPGLDDFHEFVPGLNERFRAFVLQPGGECIDIDTGIGKPGQNLFAVAAVRGQNRTRFRRDRRELSGYFPASC